MEVVSNTKKYYHSRIEVLLQVANMAIVTIKGQATIPKNIREYLGIKPGETEVEFVIVDNHVEVVNKNAVNPFSTMRGITRGKLSTDQIMALTRSE